MKPSPKQERHTEQVEYQATGLPIAPALMLDDEILLQGGPISNEALELAIRRHLPNEWRWVSLKDLNMLSFL